MWGYTAIRDKGPELLKDQLQKEYTPHLLLSLLSSYLSSPLPVPSHLLWDFLFPAPPTSAA